MKKYFLMMAMAVVALTMGVSSCSKDDDGKDVTKPWESVEVNVLDLTDFEGEWVNVDEDRETIRFSNASRGEAQVAWVFTEVKSGRASVVTNYENTVFLYLSQDHYRLVLTWDNAEKTRFTMKSMEGDYIGTKIASPRVFVKR